MFFNSSLYVAPGLANVTSIIVLKKFRDRIFTTEKLPIFNGENATIILGFLHYLSQICLSLVLVAFEKVPIFGNLKYTFLLLLIMFSLLMVVYCISRNLFIWLSIANIWYMFFCKVFLILLISS